MAAGSASGLFGHAVDGDRELPETVGAAVGMPDIGEAGHEGQGAPRPGAADPDGRVRLLDRYGTQPAVVEGDLASLVGDDLAGEETGEDLECILEAVEAATGRRKVDAELPVLGVEPGRAMASSSRPCEAWSTVQGLGGQDRRVTIR